MISLDQVQLLDKKVATMVAKMNEIQRQNAQLRSQLKDYASKNQDLIAKNESLNAANQVLQQKISTFTTDQVQIEQGILNALEKLNSMENDETNSSPLEQNSEPDTIEFGSENATTIDFEEKTPEQNVENNSQIDTDESSLNLQNNLEETQEEQSDEPSLEDDVFSFLSFDDDDTNNSENQNSDKNETLDDIF